MATLTATTAAIATTSLTSPPKITILCAKREFFLIRLLVGKEVKYLQIPDQTLPRRWDMDENLGAYLPAIPAGGDKVYRLKHTSGTRCAVFPRGGLGKQDWQAVDTTGLSVDIAVDYARVEYVRPLHTAEPNDNDHDAPRYSDKACLVRHPAMPGRLLVCRVVPFPPSLLHTRLASRGDPGVRMARELRVHERAAEHGLAPRIVALVTEAGRGVIGFLSEFVEGAVSVQEYQALRIVAGVSAEDMWPETVRQAILAPIRRIHELGILHCNLVPEHLLIAPYGRVLVIDYEFSTWMDGDGLSVDEEGKAVKSPLNITRNSELQYFIEYMKMNETKSE
jgi:predicted Ser/Thr protein kinase